MQIKVLREIDKALLNGQIYEEIIKDCQLQFAKRRLAEKRHNNLTNSYKEEVIAIEEKVNVEEDIADIFFGQEPKVKYSYENIKKKKAAESSVYAKYMAMKNSKKEESIEVSTPESAIRYNSSISGVKEHQLSSYKDNKFIKKFVSSLDIIRSSDNPVITKAVISKPKKKASESPTYQRYMELKLAPVSINSKSISSSSTTVRIPTYSSNTKRKTSNSPTYEKYMNMRVSSGSSSSSSSNSISESSSSSSSKKKKASESSIYAKYMEMKNSKKN